MNNSKIVRKREILHDDDDDSDESSCPSTEMFEDLPVEDQRSFFEYMMNNYYENHDPEKDEMEKEVEEVPNLNIEEKYEPPKDDDVICLM